MLATLYADATGALIRLTRTDLDTTLYPDPPAGTAATLQFDPATNADLVAGLLADWGGYSLTGGTLTHHGQAVSIAAPSVATTQAQQVQAQAQQVIDDITAFLALSSPTNAQTLALVKELAQVVRYLIRHDVQDQMS